MGESLVRNRNVLWRNLRMAVYLGGLAGEAGATPSSDFTRGKDDARMSQVVNVMEN